MVEPFSEGQTPRYPLQMERPNTSSKPIPQSSLASLNGANYRNSFTRRNEGYCCWRRCPFDSGKWILIEIVFHLSQMIASTIVLSLSRHENTQVSLFGWTIAYASACVATVPLLCWRFWNQRVRISARVNVLVDYLTIASHCFFVVWLLGGKFLINRFEKHSSLADATILYRLCIWLLQVCCFWFPALYIYYNVRRFWVSGEFYHMQVRNEEEQKWRQMVEGKCLCPLCSKSQPSVPE